MQTEQPSTYVHSLARWVRAHEAALSGAAAVAGPSSSSSSASSALGWLAAPGAWLGLDYLASSSAPLPPRGPAAPPRTPQRAAAARPTPLPLSTHHLYYLLLHFDSLALPTGDLAQTLPPAQRARPVSFAYVPATPSRGGIDADARSIAASVATTALSAVTFGAAGWWREKEDPMRDGRYLYSALTSECTQAHLRCEWQAEQTFSAQRSRHSPFLPRPCACLPALKMRQAQVWCRSMCSRRSPC
jgi:hypothetical protein